MFAILGILIVLGCILAGFILEKGNFDLLLSAAPPEMLMIGGRGSETGGEQWKRPVRQRRRTAYLTVRCSGGPK